MAVIHGMNSDAYLNGYDIGDWVNKVKTSHQRAMLDRTVINNSGAKSYAKGLHEGSASISGFFDHDNTANLAAESPARVEADTLEYLLHTSLGASTEDILTFFPGGATTVGDRGIGVAGYINNYDIDQNNDELTKSDWEMVGCYNREPLKLLASMASRTNSFTGTSLDNSAGTTNGGVGYLQVDNWTSGSLPVLIEHSTDNSVWSTLVTFTAAGADHVAQRIAVSGTVNRYVRAKATGTFVAEFLVAFHRK